jgi:hypothetical protein
MKTLQEISVDLNIGLPTLHKRLKKYGIKGKKKSLQVYYNNQQINELSKPLNYKQKFPNFSDIRRNDINLHITIFNYYLQGLKIENICKITGYKNSTISTIILHYKRNGNFLIVQSKMNY